jgi:hypothetical protein
MGVALYVAAVLAFGIAVAHSVLGERYILIRLFRRDDLPKLFGGTQFTARTLRLAWHITSIAWCGFAALLVLLARGQATVPGVTTVIGITFGLTAAVALFVSRGRHLSWIVFGLISALAVLN